MPTRFTGHQPHYLPSVQYLHKVASVDVFVFADMVQFEKGDWQNRNRILTADGPQMLTAPVWREDRKKVLRDVRLSGNYWREEHWKAIVQNYAGCPHWNELEPLIQPIRNVFVPYLADMCWSLLCNFVRALEIETKLVRESSLRGVAGSKSDRIISRACAIDADVYVATPNGLRTYLDREAFFNAGVEIECLGEWRPVPYPQRYEHRLGFVPNLSIIDLIANVGIGKHARQYLGKTVPVNV